MYDQFRSFAGRYVTFTEAEMRELEGRLTLRDVPKGYRLLDPGAICNEVYFINAGAMRFYYLTEEGKEITGFIFLENMFASAHTSFTYQLPSEQVLETLEPCELLVLSHGDLLDLYEKVPKINILLRKLLEERFSFAQKVLATFVMNKPETRYQAMLARRPELLQRIPQHILSSYLGITPVSLSRIRKRLAGREN